MVDIKCEKCGATSATQTAKMSKIPGALILHLKRFIVEEKENKEISLRKNKAAVGFKRTIDIEKYCDEVSERRVGARNRGSEEARKRGARKRGTRNEEGGER